MPEKPHRILLIEINLDGTVGGSHRAMFDLVRNLDRERFEPLVLFYQDNRYVRSFRELGVETRVWPAVPERGRPAYRVAALAARAAAALSTVASCRRFLREHRIDLVHLNNAPTVNFEDWLPAARLLGVRCITHARGGETLRPGPIGRLLMRRFDAVIAVSRYMAEGMVRAGVPAHLIETVHDGIDLAELRSRVKRDAAEVRRELGVGPDQVLALMVGHLRTWKGQDVVIEALQQLEPRIGERLRTCFVGRAAPVEQAYRARLERSVAEAGLGERVAFLGERTDVPDLIHAADLLIHASTVPEPFGLVVVEGMGLGKPVIASALGGPSEIFAGGDGLVFDPAEPAQLARHLERLVGSEAERRAIGAAALERAQRFDISATVRGVEAVYDRVLHGRARAA